MAQSINTRVDVVVEATSYQGLTNYGKDVYKRQLKSCSRLIISMIYGSVWSIYFHSPDNNSLGEMCIRDRCMRRLPRLQSCQMSGIVLNSGTKSRFPHHLDIKVCSLGNPLCFQKLVLAFEILNSLF